MRNSKGFTLIELMAVITLLAIILAFATWTYTRYLKSSRAESIEIAANSFEDAAESAYDDCKNGSSNSACTILNEVDNKDGSGNYTSHTVLLKDLISGGYIDEVKNPYNKSELCDKNSSYIVVTRQKVNNTHTNSDGTIQNLGEDESNIKLNYIACIRCGAVNSSVRHDMAKVMIKKGIADGDIISCTELTQTQINKLK